MDYTKTSILFAAMLSLLVTPVIMEDAFAAERIPGFMKKNIEWYVTGQISEDEFVNALTYLMNIDVIVLDQGRADAIKELRDENKALRASLSGGEIAAPFVPGGSVVSSAVSGAGQQKDSLSSAGGNGGSSTESQQQIQQQKQVPSDALDVGFVRVTDESTNAEMLIVLPTPTFKGDIGDAYFLAALSALTGEDASELEKFVDQNFVGMGNNELDPQSVMDRGIDVSAIVQMVMREQYMENTEDLRHYAEKVKMFNESKKSLREYLTDLRQYKSTLSEYEAKVSSPTTGTTVYSPTRELPVGTGEPSPVVSEGLDSLEKENESTMTEFSTLQKQYAVAEAEVFDTAQQIQENLDAKKQLREDIAELRDIITNDSWPAKFLYHDENGNEVAVVLSSSDEAKALLEKLEQSLQTLSDISQMLQLELQDAMNKQQQAMQILSNIMKNQHDTLKAIIQNMR